MATIALLYVILTLVIGLVAMFKTSFLIGLAILGGPLAAITATGGIVLGVRSPGDAVFRIGVGSFGLFLLGVAYWLSTKFSVGLFGLYVPGLWWTALGAFLGISWGLKGQPVP